MAESGKELKSFLMKVKEKSEKVGLKLHIQKMKIMESSPITSWQIDGVEMKAMTDFIFLGSKITASRNCSHEIKRCLLLGRKALTNLDSILKSRDIPLPTKVHIIKVMVFPRVIYGCENWTIKKVNTEELVLLNCGVAEGSWMARRSNQTILKGLNPEYQLEGLILKLKLQYFGHLMQKANSLEKTLMLGKVGGRRRGPQRTRWLDGITSSMDMFEQFPGDGEGQGSLACCSPWGHKESDTTEQLNNKDFKSSQGASQVALVVKAPACQCRRHKKCGFDPWVRKEMTTHSNILAWEIPRTEETGGLQSMGLQRVGHSRATRHTQNLPSSWPALSMHCCCAPGTTCLTGMEFGYMPFIHRSTK